MAINKSWNGIRMFSEWSDSAWEVFHENSKMGRHSNVVPHDIVSARMAEMLEALSYDNYPEVSLPALASTTPLRLSLLEAINTRTTARGIEPRMVALDEVATLLHCAYGVTRDNKGTVFPRPFRTVPSAGALYPLELFFHTVHVKGLEPGLYHYNPTQSNLKLIQGGDLSQQICEVTVQQEVPLNTSLIIFITAMFERSIFKYGERGYRFILLEAGHVAQNLNLVANSLGWGCINIGGYFDSKADNLLGLDGLTHSTIYMVGIGKKSEEQDLDREELL